MSIDLAYCYVSSADPERTGSYPLYGYTDGNLRRGIFGQLHAPRQRILDRRRVQFLKTEKLLSLRCVRRRAHRIVSTAP